MKLKPINSYINKNKVFTIFCALSLSITAYNAILPIFKIEEKHSLKNKKMKIKLICLSVLNFYRENRRLPKFLTELKSSSDKKITIEDSDIHDKYNKPLYYKKINNKTFEVGLFNNNPFFKTKSELDNKIGIHKVTINLILNEYIFEKRDNK